MNNFSMPDPDQKNAKEHYFSLFNFVRYNLWWLNSLHDMYMYLNKNISGSSGRFNSGLLNKS